MSNKNDFRYKFASWITDKPFQPLIVGLVFLIALGAGMPHLTSDFSYRVWFKESSKRLQAFDAFERKFGSDDVAVIGVYSKNGVFNKKTAQLVIDLTEDMWQVPEVIRVDSLSNFNWVHGEGDDIIVDSFIPNDLELTDDLLLQRAQVASTDPNIKNYLISQDQNTTLLYVNLKPSLDKLPDYQVVNEALRKTIDKYKSSEKYGDASDYEFHITGSPALSFGFQESSQNDMKKLVPLVFFITLLFLALFFRRVSGVFLPLLVIFPSIIATLGWSGWLGIEMNVMTSIVPQYLIALSIAVVVHLLVSFYQFGAKGLSKHDALRLALDKNFLPTLLTSISTAIGFMSFTTASMPTIQKLGILSGFGTLFAWLFTYLFVGPIISMVPIKMNRKSKDTGDVLKATPRSYFVTDLLIRFRRPMIAVFAVLCSVSLYLAANTRVSSDPFDYFDKAYPLSIANYFVEDSVGGSMGIETVIESGEAEGIKDPQFLKKVDEFQTWVQSHDFVSKTVSPVDFLKDMNKTLNGGKQEFYKLADSRELLSQQLFLYTMNLPQGMDVNNRITIENDAIRMTAMNTLHESDLFMDFIYKMEDKAAEMGIKAWVTGKGPLYQSNNELVVDSFRASLTLAIFLVSLLLIWGLQSVKTGLLSIIPNAVPLVLGSGLLYMMGATLDIGTVIIASVCLGIAVDDTIHFLANYRRFRGEGDSPREAIAKVFTNTVPALVTTTVVLVAAFGCFILATFVPNQNFGFFVAVVLFIALITDLTLLPALLLTFDGGEVVPAGGSGQEPVKSGEKASIPDSNHSRVARGPEALNPPGMTPQ